MNTEPRKSAKEPSNRADIQKYIDQAKDRQRKELGQKLAAGQLMLWPTDERGIPNELVRCSLFSSKNRRIPRITYKPGMPVVIPIVGGGRIIFWGEELRQDDETVWLHLIHLSKEARQEWVEFRPRAFVQAIRWPVNGESYARLLTTLRRLSTVGLEVYSQRFDKGVNVKLVDRYEYSEGERTPWRVRVFDPQADLLCLYDRLYTRLEWERRLDLPAGVATWLHGFYSSHREPHPHKLETLAVGAGLTLVKDEDDQLSEEDRKKVVTQRHKDARKTLKEAHEVLVAKNFLKTFEFKKGAEKGVLQMLAVVRRATAIERKQEPIEF